MQAFVDFTNGIISSPAMTYLRLGAGLFSSILIRFVQLQMFRDICVPLFSGSQAEPEFAPARI
ncbi:hypothetical protein KDX31_03730 [Amphritea atlantica]|uniref:Uncharacterized protein n=1 Tax=Amphritea atlantica TaxID=355243 RepID=A0ABY5GVW8_9GAMM|nr:hypothetical protein KDX31_03730 [Amphritea atlantica]